MAIFQDNLVKPVPERLHSGFYWIKDDGGGGDIQSCKMLSSSQIIATNKQTTAFLSPNQQYHNQNTEGKMYHIPQTCSSKLTWQFPSFSWPSKAPHYLGRRLPSISSALRLTKSHYLYQITKHNLAKSQNKFAPVKLHARL